MKVQRVGALMEQVAMGLPKQLVPARKNQGWLGPAEAASLRTTPSLAREVRPESSRLAMTAGRERSPDRPEQREGTRKGPGRPQGWRNASSKTACGSGTSEQYRGSFALRQVANRSIDGLPHARRSALAT